MARQEANGDLRFELQQRSVNLMHEVQVLSEQLLHLYLASQQSALQRRVRKQSLRERASTAAHPK
jgi:hypothetical protein